MNQLQLFLPCAAGVEGFLADEVHGITGLTGQDLLVGRGGVLLRASWRQAMHMSSHQSRCEPEQSPSHLVMAELQTESASAVPPAPSAARARPALSKALRIAFI